MIRSSRITRYKFIMNIKCEVEFTEEFEGNIKDELTCAFPIKHSEFSKENEGEEEFSEDNNAKNIVRSRVKDTKKFQCPVCPFTACHKSRIKSHSLVHSGEKPYKCSHCDFASNRKTNLNKHLLRHSDTKLFSCSQ
ncbi:Zinc finger and BTB domain-containing protein 46, partial [Armadillidium nasatum]